jgi:hypothetical protein
MLNFTAKKSEEENSGNHWGDFSKPFTFILPDWKWSLHIPHLHAGVG